SSPYERFGHAHDPSEMSAQAALAALAAAALAVAALAMLAERRRARRADLDRPGWVPWALVQVLALIAGVVAAVLALKA
ncbi:MAG TPA: hypothetical protein VGW34_11795, partial [Allosphingosinicella sp.]|nr:hypothetical protein [Allosphingosinicella sp.]